VVAERSEQITGIGVPDAPGLIGARGHDPVTAVAELGVEDRTGVARQFEVRRAGSRVPDSRNPAGASRDDAIARRGSARSSRIRLTSWDTDRPLGMSKTRATRSRAAASSTVTSNSRRHERRRRNRMWML
jgi:hypothetical protein